MNRESEFVFLDSIAFNEMSNNIVEPIERHGYGKWKRA
jgi:hypothetical protein